MKKRILIIDDHDIFAQALKVTLESIINNNNYLIDVFAEDLDEAGSFSKINKNEIILIFLDVYIKGIVIDDFFIKLPDSLKDKVYLISSYAQDMQDMRIKLNLPPDRVFNKPIIEEQIRHLWENLNKES